MEEGKAVLKRQKRENRWGKEGEDLELRGKRRGARMLVAPEIGWDGKNLKFCMPNRGGERGKLVGLVGWAEN